MRKALRMIPEKQREAVWYCYYLQRTQEETGEIVGCSGRAVRYRLNSAFKNLKKILIQPS